MTRTIRALLMLAVVGAAPLLAQDPRLSARLDPATAAEVSAVVASARTAGLPTEPLVDRALEGASKGAPGGRIVSAVRALARDLQTSRGALGMHSSDAEVSAGASAIRAGAQVRALERLRSARRQMTLTVPLGVLADLITRGVPADTAARVVMLLAEAGANDAEYVSLRRSVERDIRAGAPPSVAASLRARGMPSTLPPSSPGVIAAPGAPEGVRQGNRP